MPPVTPSSAASTPTARPRPADELSGGRRAAGLLFRLDVHRRLAEHRSPLGTADGRLLWLLSDGRARTLREIAEALRLEQSTVNRQVNGALAAGLLRRFTAPGRSARLLEPTEEGLARFEDATSQALGGYADGLAALGDDAGVFLELLGRFTEAYGEAVREG
ncbi:MarR family winged helix-turn-helix transcriptional regulator [Isoptericola sp. F-RaC21]|uniref:MarR family winged helix-turn-helix transcriptional regulator n=1 Tax=Isoptericola sp. F-RaC21 TaxID=3141452 RepID=UPI00315C3C4A